MIANARELCYYINIVLSIRFTNRIEGLFGSADMSGGS